MGWKRGNMNKKVLIDLSGKENVLYDDKKIIDITSECLNIDSERIRIVNEEQSVRDMEIRLKNCIKLMNVKKKDGRLEMWQIKDIFSREFPELKEWINCL